MNDNVLYEMVVEKNHLNLIKQSLSLQINNLYEAVDADVVNTEKAYEDIKVLSDMLAVLRGSDRSVKQTSETTGLIWYKEINLDEQEESFEPFNDVNLQSYTCEDEFSELTAEQIEYLNGRMKRSWNNVKDRHWDTIKRIGDR